MGGIVIDLTYCNNFLFDIQDINLHIEIKAFLIISLTVTCTHMHLICILSKPQDRRFV